MTRVTLPHDERLLDLLADFAMEGLDAPAEAELHERARAMGVDLLVDPLTCSAACCELALMSRSQFVPMPTAVCERLERLGAEWARTQTGGPIAEIGAGGVVRGVAVPGGVVRGGSSTSAVGRVLPWLVAAASVALAVFAWLPSPAANPTRMLAELKTKAPDVVSATWGDWDGPEVAGVKGEVYWSDAKQTGVMHFVGLPTCKASERYQLWIIDGTRGMEQRISGGVFDGAPGEVYVPITPGIHVNQAAAFAVTIEKPEGTWVSDMKRRVVIAKKT